MSVLPLFDKLLNRLRPPAEQPLLLFQDFDSRQGTRIVQPDHGRPAEVRMPLDLTRGPLDP